MNGNILDSTNASRIILKQKSMLTLKQIGSAFLMRFEMIRSIKLDIQIFLFFFSFLNTYQGIKIEFRLKKSNLIYNLSTYQECTYIYGYYKFVHICRSYKI